MKILLTEDDSTTAIVLRKALEKRGHEVTLARDGEAAWLLLRQDSHRLLISDWMMPKMDGLELCRKLRSRVDHPYVYVILLTAKGMPEDRLAGLEAGADDFLVKPLDPGDLIARLEVAQRILALQENVRARSQQLEKLREQLEKQAEPLGEILIAHNVLSPAILRQALDQQARTGQVLGSILIANGWASEEDVVRARSVQLDTPYVAVANESPDQAVLALVPPEVALRHRLLPLGVYTGEGDGVRRLRVALSNPWNIEGIDLVQRQTRLQVEPLLASESALHAALERAYGIADSDTNDALLSDSIELAMEDVASVANAAEEVDTAEVVQQSEQAPVIRLINTLITDAVRRRASDIHLEPYKRDFEIRYRIDGQLHVVRTLGRPFLAAATSRIKIMADMDISERRLPQDGRMALRVDGKEIDLRVSTLPAQFGERVVMRLLDRSRACLSLDQLDFSVANQQAFQKLIHRPHGMVLVTGPTGSGKTTTLYATLNALRSPGINIMTCEDPIEYEVDGSAFFRRPPLGWGRLPTLRSDRHPGARRDPRGAVGRRADPALDLAAIRHPDHPPSRPRQRHDPLDHRRPGKGPGGFGDAGRRFAQSEHGQSPHSDMTRRAAPSTLHAFGLRRIMKPLWPKPPRPTPPRSSRF